MPEPASFREAMVGKAAESPDIIKKIIESVSLSQDDPNLDITAEFKERAAGKLSYCALGPEDAEDVVVRYFANKVKEKTSDDEA